MIFDFLAGWPRIPFPDLTHSIGLSARFLSSCIYSFDFLPILSPHLVITAFCVLSAITDKTEILR